MLDPHRKDSGSPPAAGEDSMCRAASWKLDTVMGVHVLSRVTSYKH
jgi:hypothetical protein